MGPGFVRRDVRLELEAAEARGAVLQWGPASFAGMCEVEHGIVREGWTLQWGPASFAGMCRGGQRVGVGQGPRASMGPGFVRRDVRHHQPAHAPDRAASMGPGFVRRDVHAGRNRDPLARLASMGPGFVRRDVLVGAPT